jgi:hypothetical protein
MTVLGTATKVYAGGVAASAVYAGSVKVWPTAPPEPPAVVWPVVPDAGLVLHVHATLQEMQAPGQHPIDLQLTQSFRDAAGYMGTAAPTWRSSDYNGGTIRDLTVTIAGLAAKFSQVVAAESATLVTLEHVAGTGIGTWRMRVTQ